MTSTMRSMQLRFVQRLTALYTAEDVLDGNFRRRILQVRMLVEIENAGEIWTDWEDVPEFDEELLDEVEESIASDNKEKSPDDLGL